MKMKNIADTTLAALVTRNHHVVPVLEKYNLDFCCKGKRLLADACQEKGLDTRLVELELQDVMGVETKRSMPFTEMTAEQLINHILIHHHFYVKQSMPTIYSHLQKVVSKHGERFPWMVEVFRLFAEVQQEMTAHMQKEEVILFPRIKAMENNGFGTPGQSPDSPFLNGPIAMMEAEHEAAGNLLFRIRELTHNYCPPEGACTTFRVSLAELKEFEDDLHIHVHLENNILFPRFRMQEVVREA
jgi:regulator of cell morphogenesis and NO signaling